MQVERAPAVVEVDAVEAREVERVRVVDDDIVGELHRKTVATPTLAQITVLGRGTRKALVEPANVEELVARDDEVVGREEPDGRVVMPVVLVQIVDDPLARGRVDVVGEYVDRLSAERRGL